MKRYFVAIDIAAPAARVWALVSDAASYADWNSTIDRFEGAFAPGATVTLHAHAMPNRPFKLTVKAWEPPRRFVLEGGAPLGLFVGTRWLEVTPQGADACRFEMEETLHGPLSALMARFIPDQQPTFDAFAADLKRRAERG
jgi:uncharacterized protein YndB with AHSA1/START domain